MPAQPRFQYPYWCKHLLNPIKLSTVLSSIGRLCWYLKANSDVSHVQARLNESTPAGERLIWTLNQAHLRQAWNAYLFFLPTCCSYGTSAILNLRTLITPDRNDVVIIECSPVRIYYHIIGNKFDTCFP